jgi:hypothetical protein
MALMLFGTMMMTSAMALPRHTEWPLGFANCWLAVLAAANTHGQLLGWVGQQLQLLPQQLQQLLVPAVVHMAEQQLHGLLGRSQLDLPTCKLANNLLKEVEGLEHVLLFV